MSLGRTWVWLGAGFSTTGLLLYSPFNSIFKVRIASGGYPFSYYFSKICIYRVFGWIFNFFLFEGEVIWWPSLGYLFFFLSDLITFRNTNLAVVMYQLMRIL